MKLDRRDAQILVITGPNVAGKSTVMRQVAQIVLLVAPVLRAHPATRATRAEIQDTRSPVSMPCTPELKEQA